MSGKRDRFIEYIRRHKDVSFCWGVDDCFLFAACWACECRGGDLPEWPECENERQAAAHIKNYGGIVNIFSDNVGLGAPMHNIKLAQCGDVVLCDFMGAQMMGIVDETAAGIACLSKKGIVRIPVKHIKKAWRVECLR